MHLRIYLSLHSLVFSRRLTYLQYLVITAEFNDEHGLGISLGNLARFYQATQDEDLLVEVANMFEMTVEELKKAIINSEE
jgi:hypothetical protein